MRQEGKNNWVRKAKEKGIEVQKVRPHTPSRAIGALIGDEEQTGKEKKGTGRELPFQLPWTIWLCVCVCL